MLAENCTLKDEESPDRPIQHWRENVERCSTIPRQVDEVHSDRDNGSTTRARGTITRQVYGVSRRAGQWNDDLFT